MLDLLDHIQRDPEWALQEIVSLRRELKWFEDEFAAFPKVADMMRSRGY